MSSITTSFTDAILINGKLYSKKSLTLEWFQMSNDCFFQKYEFNFNPHDYPGLYDWGRKTLFKENCDDWRAKLW